MAITLPDLPYAIDALTPHISENTIQFHYGKHHSTYVTNVNKLLEGRSDLADQSLEDIIKKTVNDGPLTGVFNNAAQVWNRSFYWKCMKPQGGGAPSGVIAGMIHSAFGSYEKFIEQFKNAGVTQFGSGWAWLVMNGDKLEITKTSNADTPLAHGLKPLLTVDVWEHAYYLDYQNKRPGYLSAFVENLVNWDFVNTLI
jgi:Fe-Mn family superoxide dismutase